MNSEDDIVVDETVIAFLSDDGWKEGLVEWAQVVRTSTGRRQTAYHVCSEEEQTLYTIGLNDSTPLHEMEWWIVGHKQTADCTCEAEDHCQALASAIPPPSSSSEEDFPPFDPLTGSPVPPPPITPHCWLQYHNAPVDTNDNSSSTSDSNVEWLTVGTRHFYLEGVQLPSGDYGIGRPARNEDGKTSKEAGKPAPKKQKPKVPIAKIRGMIKDNVSAQYRLDNPKRKRSKARRRYDMYKVARTLQEAVSLGSTLADVCTDIEKGYVVVKQVAVTDEGDSGSALDRMIAEGEDLINQIKEFSEDIQASTDGNRGLECPTTVNPEMCVASRALNEESVGCDDAGTCRKAAPTPPPVRRSKRLRTQLSNQALEALCATSVVVLLSSDHTLGATQQLSATARKRTRTRAEIELLCANDKKKKQRTLEQHKFYKKPP